MVFFRCSTHWSGFLGGTVVNESTQKCRRQRDVGSISGSGTSAELENGNPFCYSCLENSMDRGVWRATVHGVAKRQTQLSTNTHTHTHTHTHKHCLPVLIHLKLFTTRKMKLSVVPSYHPSPWLCPGLTTLVLWVKKAFRRFISNKYKWENGTIFTISRDIIVWKFHQSWSRCLKTWVWVQVLILRDCRS